jgi:hypothetical protein
MAAMLPKAVETVAAINAIKMVLTMASISELFMPPEKSELYSLNEKPVQLPNTFASVNEKIMIIRMGA